MTYRGANQAERPQKTAHDRLMTVTDEPRRADSSWPHARIEAPESTTPQTKRSKIEVP